MFISTNKFQMLDSKYWNVELQCIRLTCSIKSSFHFSIARICRSEYCTCRSDVTKTRSNAMNCLSTMEDNFSIKAFPVLISSTNTSNLVVSLSNCVPMTSTIRVFLFEPLNDGVPSDGANKPNWVKHEL